MTESSTLAESGLLWSIRRSFRDYVLALDDGEEHVSPDVVRREDGTFLFPLVEADLDAGAATGVLRFGGRVGYRGHGGMLAAAFIEPWIQLGEDKTELSVINGEDRWSKRIVLAEWPGARALLEQGLARWDVAAPALTFDGVRLLGDVYPVGSPLDPLALAVAVRA